MPSLFQRFGPLWPALIALASGALTVLGFAPFNWFPIAILSLALFYDQLIESSPRQGFWRGWLFGVGLFGFGVFWIRISLNEFGNMDAWVAQLLTALFIAAMALYYGLAGWLIRRLDLSRNWTTPVLVFPAIYLLTEWLRGWLFTGFPWLNLGYTQIDGPLAGYAPVMGVYGVTLLAALSSGLLWALVRWSGRARALAGAALAAIWFSGAGLQQVEWTHPNGPPLKVSVLQANIPQSMKWTPEGGMAIAQAYLELTRDHLDSDLIVWPETALPDFLHQLRAPLIDPLAERARAEGTEIVLGIPVLDVETRRYYNGLLSIGSHEDLYAKRHLVPFGEFMPFKNWLGPLVELFEVPMSDFSPGDAERPLLTVGRYQVGVSICYEDAFPSEVVEALPEAEYLINVSNDAWFGDSLAPHQHLEMARMRALENGRALVRATNTGVSAIIDQRGRLAATLPSFIRGATSAEIQPRQGATPFARLHNQLAIGLALAMLGIAVARSRRARSNAT
ncbi:Apolipoprotein N-acyltransferase [Thiorhodococcus drewsii AZ1]|uniref:Apolipoprotein N-acyltransferase n=1 Tax=Thiorhodococcus drewsii AZ1 TaxID=765913 RepID=G2E389_9GAMM|nr:apolipoprotein N-acyltransferase [Thiorhodococcus drewsii]EGV30278.1 Apolipoprotein N-acyltransferase [Thiorhodococcus drewsii AZ1]